MSKGKAMGLDDCVKTINTYCTKQLKVKYIILCLLPFSIFELEMKAKPDKMLSQNKHTSF